MMQRKLGSRYARYFYAAIIILILGVGIAGCNERTPYTAGPRGCAKQFSSLGAIQKTEIQKLILKSPQCAWQIGVILDRKALFPGYVLITDRISIPLGQPFQFAVTVCGTVEACGEVNRVREEIPASYMGAQPEPKRLQGKLEIGARIDAQLTGYIPRGIQRNSQEVQPIVESADSATWRWAIDPSRAGTFELNLTFTPLIGASDSPLVPTVSFPIRIEVTASTSQKVSSTVASATHSLITMAGLAETLGLGSLAALASLLYRRAKREKFNRRKSPENSSPETTEPPSEEPGSAQPNVSESSENLSGT